MNRESSRSHFVFMCVIESRLEKDSTSNMRIARLNLVALVGSERKKSFGAEGERLKEAANINKSLSTLGHVITMTLQMSYLSLSSHHGRITQNLKHIIFSNAQDKNKRINRQMLKRRKISC